MSHRTRKKKMPQRMRNAYGGGNLFVYVCNGFIGIVFALMRVSCKVPSVSGGGGVGGIIVVLNASTPRFNRLNFMSQLVRARNEHRIGVFFSSLKVLALYNIIG